MESAMRRGGGLRVLVRHYLEMVAAMVLGMLTLFPLWTAVAGGSGTGWTATTEVEALAMATAMAVPMAGWMVVRGHGVAAAGEMSFAMYVGFVMFFPLLWSDVIGRSAVLGLGHVAMLLVMGLVMLRRPHPHLRRA